MSFDDFVIDEYDKYCETTDDPMQFDDWYHGSDYLESLFERIAK